MNRRLRLFYAGGPGNVIGTYRHWRAGADDPSEVSATYSGQFWNLCRELGAISYVVSSHHRKAAIRDGDFRVEHRPKPGPDARGLKYHLLQAWYGLGLVCSALLFRADFAIVSMGMTHWFVLSVLPIFGIRVIPDIHCVLWSKFQEPSRTERILREIDRRLLFHTRAHATLTASPEIARQVRELGAQNPVIEFLPTYYRETFEHIACSSTSRPFRVLFAGRIEKNKGVFDVLDIARRYRAHGVSGIVFDICGGGTALVALREQSARVGLGADFICHGHLGREEMKAMFSNCHIVLVPTTSDFREGLNRVVVEGVLSGRPVVTSSVCPALDSVRDAVLEVPPDNVSGYHDAILRLRDDAELYASKSHACKVYQDQFYDEANGWGNALRRVLGKPIPSATQLARPAAT
jgi:glycogen synthase